MSALKIKDDQGNWINLPGLKGDKGDKGDKGESGVYLGTTAPSDEDINVWINPNGEAHTEAVVVDPTLTMEGQAADAKVVGDKITNLKSEITNDNKYILSDAPAYTLDLVNGARGATPQITASTRYVTNKTLLSYPAGTVIKISTTNSAVKILLTEWQEQTNIGNVGSWASNVTYTFRDGISITVNFKANGGTSDLSPTQTGYVAELETKYSKNTTVVDNIRENGSLRVIMSVFQQGYYNASGALASSSNFASTPMYISDNNDTVFIVRYSDVYDISCYTWDYSNGTYSNFAQTGWITKDTTISIPIGKAFSLTFRTKGGGATPSGQIDYIYYLSNTNIERLYSAEIIDYWIPKKVACVGDSLTQGVDIGTHVIAENYPYFMSKMLGCEVLNYGVAGADTKEYWHDNIDDFTFDSTIDTVLIMLGTNGSGIPNTLETDVYPYTDYNDYADTYCGCYCKIIRKIIELTQNIAQVILITPPYTTYSTAQLNRVKEARETIKEVGLHFNIPVIDVFAECGMGAYNASVFRPHDGCHFNAKGYHRLGTFIGSKVKALHSEWSLDDEYSDETPIT